MMMMMMMLLMMNDVVDDDKDDKDDNGDQTYPNGQRFFFEHRHGEWVIPQAVE